MNLYSGRHLIPLFFIQLKLRLVIISLILETLNMGYLMSIWNDTFTNSKYIVAQTSSQGQKSSSYLALTYNIHLFIKTGGP